MIDIDDGDKLKHEPMKSLNSNNKIVIHIMIWHWWEFNL